jgi:TAT-translocated FGD2 family F420-dependent dehydrogenase
VSQEEQDRPERGLSRRQFATLAAAGVAAGALGAGVRPAGAAPGRTYGGLHVGFVLSHEQFRTPKLVEIAAAAERAGFTYAWMSDHAQPWQANQGHSMFPWVTAALVGERTSRLTFGPGVTAPTYRHHPSDVAQAWSSLALLNPGRVFLALGTGEAVNELAMTGRFGPYQERHDRLIEAIELIRQLWTGKVTSFKGTYFQTEQARLWDLPREPIPLYVAASGPRSAALAGQYGDGWVTGAQDLTKPALANAFASGARGAGKDPARMPKLVEHFVFVGERAQAHEEARKWWFTLNPWGKLLQIPSPGEIQRQAPTEGSLSKLLDQWLISPDPAVHAEALRKLRRQGATHVFVHSAQTDQAGVAEFYGRRVLPRLRR